jgi:neuronal PAS domain-containing protein 1/3
LTHYYRIMNKNGGFTWIQTCATVVCSAKNADEQNIICVNYVVSGREGDNYVYDQCQLGIKREPYVFKRIENDTRLSDKKPDSLQNDAKLKVSVSPEMEKCDEESQSLPAVSKRGRKRKMKNENLDEEIVEKCSPGSDSNLNDLPVKQLENAMAKHLPKPSLNDPNNSTDFSADSLLRQQSDKSHATNDHQPSSPMPATALLRQLYANRESVIRATTKPSNFLFPDNSYLTPPNDSYDSQFLRKSGETFNSFVSTYGTYPSMEYNSAMTPPSSVSPRDLTNQKSTRGSCEYTNLATSTSGDNRVQYQTHESLPQLPLKPHPYSIHHQMDPSYSIDHQSQYFPYHSGFHLYHKSHVYTPP